MKRRRLSVCPAEYLHRLGLLIAFVLLVAAGEFSSTHSALTAGLVFVFSLGYLVASIMTRRAGFLYGTMLFGAVAFFLMCHGLGAPGTLFPLLSVVLVVCLFLVGRRLTRLPEEQSSFPLTVFRAMNTTVAVFGLWALFQVGGLMEQGGWMRQVAGLTFVGYAAVYLAHRVTGARAIHTYVFGLFLTLGGMLLLGGTWSVDLAWIAAMAAAGVILLVGTGLHVERGHGWSRHFYFCAAPVILVSLVFACWRWPFLLVDLAVGSLLLWVAYDRLAGSVTVVGAAMAERVVAKCFLFGAALLAIPVAPMVFLQAGNVYVALAAVIAGATFMWVGWRRRQQAGTMGESYVLAGVMFASAGLLGLGRQLPGVAEAVWGIAVGPLLLAGLGSVGIALKKTENVLLGRRVAAGSIFPAFLGWYFLAVQGEPGMALAAALVAVGVLVGLSAGLKDKTYCYGLGPAIAGVVVGAVLLAAPESMVAWVAGLVAAAISAVLFAGAGGRKVLRGAAGLAWLILSVAAVVIAGVIGALEALYSVTAVGVLAVLVAWRPGRRERDVFEWLAQGLALLATSAAVVMAALASSIGIGPVVAGVCLLIISAAYWLVWAVQGGRGAARLGNWLLALGALLVIFNVFPAAEVRLAAGAVVVGILFLGAAVCSKRFGAMAGTAVMTGHLVSMVLVVAALIQAWHMGASRLYLAAAPLVVFYAFMPRLRGNQGLRLGTALWISFAILLGIAARADTPYEQQIHLMVLLSLVWLVAGKLLDRTKAKAWSMPLYITAAVVASFCCIVRMLGPVTDTSWLIFLLSGVVFVGLFVTVREDIFAYLLSVALALMGYDWLRGTSSTFTVDLFSCLAITGIVLAVLFLLPHLARRITRLGSVPMFSIFTWLGAGLLMLVVVVIGVVGISAYGIKITGHPKFCISCHNMDEYYTSWEHSSHGEVACISCHYKPGVAATAVGKAQGMVQLVQYISGSYATKPHGEISDASCQRSACHEGIEKSDEVLVFNGEANFRHDQHLTGEVQGMALNCVSCHGQTSPETHISINKDTCMTCHLYGGAGEVAALGECHTCHSVPKEPVRFMEASFDHREFLAGGGDVTCRHCHSQVTQGTGPVSQGACERCHLGGRDEVADARELHLHHVTNEHMECVSCHGKIKHGVSPMASQLLTSNDCSTCHGEERHSVQEKVYAGIALPDMDAMPDVMYEAGVACDGCHDDTQIIKMGEFTLTSRTSGAKQCVDCHANNEDYAEQLAEWQESTKEMIDELQPALEKLAEACDPSDASSAEMVQARKLLALARTRLNIVIRDGSHGGHNIGYVTEILDKAIEEVEMGQSLVRQLKVADSKAQVRE